MLYTKKEELANTITHIIGVTLSIFALILMVQKSDNITSLTSSLLYGISMLLLYFSSSMYHAVQNPKIKPHLRTLDHCCIFLLIAASYTPYSLITLHGRIGNIIFIINWVLAVIGIILNIVSVKKFSKLSLVVYLVMGWLVVFTIKPLYENLHATGLTLLVLCGIFYTVGVYFYKSKKIAYAHAIWHLFVLAGSICHFLSVYLYVI